MAMHEGNSSFLLEKDTLDMTFVDTLAILCLFLALYLPVIDAWRPHLPVKRIVAAGVSLSVSLGPFGEGANSAHASSDYKQELAVKQCARVYHSLQNIYDDIENNGADAISVRKQVSLVQKNYGLRDNIRKSLEDVDGLKKKDEAYSHGLQSIEDLALIFEYIEDSIDDSTGKKTPSPETLKIAEKAIMAAKEELATFLAYVPYGKSTIDAIKREEFSY